MVNVPAGYRQYVQEAASGTGLPVNVVAAHANIESGFNARAVSPSGAEGWLQFLPSTYNAYAAQAGVQQGTEFNVADETKVYIAYMNKLLKDEGGSIFKALEAYDAGEGNLDAGSGYASSILSAAGVPQNAKAGTPAQTTSATTTGCSITNPLGCIPGGGAFSSAIGDIFTKPLEGIMQWIGKSIFGSLGIPTFKDLLQRLGLILFGAFMVYLGIRMMTSNTKSGGGAQPSQRQSEEPEQATERPESAAGESGPSTEVLSPASGTGGTEAMEAAAVA